MPEVIILAGGSISGKLAFLRSRCPSPALIPINTRPLAAYLIDFYAEHPNCRLHLVVNSEVEDSVRAELGMAEGRYKMKPVSQTDGVVDSLALAVKDFSDDDDVIVNLVTTVPTRLVQKDEVLVATQTTHSSDWSGIVLGSENPTFSSKTAPLLTCSHAFTGVFRCEFRELASAIRSVTDRNDLLAVVMQLQSFHPLRYGTCDWIDCGHETNYYEAKSKLISSRSFNRVQVSLEDGVLKKSSSDAVKLKRESDFVQMLPASIEVYFPRILSSGPGVVEFEYYGYPTVGEYLLYWDLSPDNWRRLFSRLERVLQRFKAFPYSIGNLAFHDFYIQKTAKRLETYLASLDPALQEVLEGEIMINGQLCQPFGALKAKLQERLQQMYKDDDFCVMHGDFCFSNILYDVPSGIVRLIDPRGSFGERCVGIYGDQKYDLAKLKHSAEYGYDFIVNGLYTLRCQGSQLDYTLATRECSSLVARLSRNVISELGYQNEEIELLTSLLFLSMCPLHAEDSNRQLVMYAHGLRLLNSCLENINYVRNLH